MSQSEVQFASLLASRLCHDLVNPAGALNTGLDVLATENDPEMRQHAESLVKESTSRLLAMIEFARIAYGASGGGGGSVGTDELRILAEKLFAHVKPELNWAVETAALPKLEGRVLLNLLLLAERIVPRNGSTVTVLADGESVSMVCAGPRARFPEDIENAFAGQGEDEPKVMPARLAKALADEVGKSLSHEAIEEQVSIKLS